MKRNNIIALACFVSAALVIVGASCTKQEGAEQNQQGGEKQSVRIGYFPNITHSQAVVGMQDGTFQQYLGDDVEIVPLTFNSGTTEIEALFAGEIDLGYIGPSPAINGYVKSEGQALRIISGANSGGAALVGTSELAAAFKAQGAQALKGMKIATPSLGNTQDISLRHYLAANNLTDDVEIIPIANADQLTMFTQGDLDGCWAPEPWASRIIIEADGELIIDERDLWEGDKFITTNIVANTDFLNEHPDLVRKFLEAHVELTDWIIANPAEAQTVVNSEIERITSARIADNVLEMAWERIDPTVDPLSDTALEFSEWAFDNGFLGEEKPNLDDLYDLTILNEITNQQYQ
ncbi:MAG: aliphatic sulfonate ABC transporter substrate-binding protein [Candidatus Kerfeldbacteria bacterium]